MIAILPIIRYPTSLGRRVSDILINSLPLNQFFRPTVSREIVSVHIEDHRDVFGEGGFLEDGLDVVGERAGFVGAEGDLETELVVGADQGAGEDFA